jgi:hypothetical protein
MQNNSSYYSCTMCSVEQRVLNDLRSTRLSRRRIIGSSPALHCKTEKERQLDNLGGYGRSQRESQALYKLFNILWFTLYSNVLKTGTDLAPGLF